MIFLYIVVLSYYDVLTCFALIFLSEGFSATSIIGVAPAMFKNDRGHFSLA